MNSNKPVSKKLVIRPLKLQPRLPDDFETTNWDRLQQAIHAVQAASPVSSSLEELYQAVEDLCVHNLGTKLYAQLQEECDQHARRTLDALAAWSSLDASAFLEPVSRTWASFCSQIILIRQIFLYLDRTHVLTSASARSIYDMGLAHFCTHLARHPEVQRKTVDGLLALIDAERSGEAVDRALVRDLLRMLTGLGLYGTAFQGAFLESSTRFYAVEGERLIQVSPNMSCGMGFAMHIPSRKETDHMLSPPRPAAALPLQVIHCLHCPPRISSLRSLKFPPTWCTASSGWPRSTRGAMRTWSHPRASPSWRRTSVGVGGLFYITSHYFPSCF